MPATRGLPALLQTSRQTSRTHISRRKLSSVSAVLPRLAIQHRQAPSQTTPTTPRWSSQSSFQRRHASDSSSNLKQTPLYDAHVAAKAKLVPFANFSMPLTYADQTQTDSHNWTRENASLFDVSHMVQHKLSGPLACQFLETITPSSVSSLEKHTSTLSTLLDSNGGIVDDTVITRLGRDSFYFVTNAGCRETDLEFLSSQMGAFLKKQDAKADGTNIDWHILDHHSLLALQGPKAVEVLQPLVFRDTEDDQIDTDLSTLYFGQSRWLQLYLPSDCTKEGTELSTPSLLISRTGYTGEDGFEISIPPEHGSSAALAQAISKALLSSGVTKWAGLAARDSLRLEAGMCLYGHDISTSTTPPQAALGWIVPKSRRTADAGFNGAEVIVPQLEKPSRMPSRRVGFEIEKGAAAREGAEIVALDESGKEVQGEEGKLGTVTSGGPSPSLGGRNIAMGYIKNGWHKKGTKVGIKVRGKVKEGEVVKMPFVESRFHRMA